MEILVNIEVAPTLLRDPAILEREGEPTGSEWQSLPHPFVLHPDHAPLDVVTDSRLIRLP